jgi:hypothetical protein
MRSSLALGPRAVAMKGSFLIASLCSLGGCRRCVVEV